MQYCSLQHWALFSPPDESTAEHHFCFGPTSSFFLELFLCSFPGAYWTSSDLRGISSGVIYFCLFILLMGFSRQEHWSGLPFPPSVDHVLSELSPMTHPSWVALHHLAHSFIELHKSLHHKARTSKNQRRNELWQRRTPLFWTVREYQCLEGRHCGCFTPEYIFPRPSYSVPLRGPRILYTANVYIDCQKASFSSCHL